MTPATILAVIYVAIPSLVWLYSFWITSKKDGFDQEKVFDLVIYGLVGALVLGFATAKISSGKLDFTNFSINSYAAIFGFIGVATLATLSYKWSVYRLLDNLATSFVLATAVWFMTAFLQSQFKVSYLIAFAALPLANYALQKYRPAFIKSGMTFSLVTGTFCLAAFLLLPRDLNLIFVGLLFTLSLTVLIFRLRSIYGKQTDGRH